MCSGSQATKTSMKATARVATFIAGPHPLPDTVGSRATTAAAANAIAARIVGRTFKSLHGCVTHVD